MLAGAANRVQRNLRRDFQAVSLKSDELARVIREDPHGTDVQSRQDLNADAVFALLAAQADGFVGVGAVLAVIFE